MLSIGRNIQLAAGDWPNPQLLMSRWKTERPDEVIKARVTITLKNGVLDPQGKAIEGALHGLGFSGIGSVRQGKVFDIELEGTDKAAAENSLKEMCERLLANTVIENYSVTIL